ncbi:MAG TPA: hypothetical protein VGL58_11665 [Caulobacteraceae bacterium]
MAELDDIVAVLPPLVRTMEALGFVARYFNAVDYEALLARVGDVETSLKAERPRLDTWPARLDDVRGALVDASDRMIAAFEALRAAPTAPDQLRTTVQGLRQLPHAQEALWPLAANLPPVSRYFLAPEHRDDAALLARLDVSSPRADTGLFHVDNEPGDRGGHSIFVPEDYTPDRAWPLIVALHGGAGNGRSFIWNWLRDARARGAILISPTALGPTWALNGQDIDTPNLQAMVDDACSRWNVDRSRLLMTGLSDGGTFTYVSGLEPTSPFTHLAPASASFHPVLAQMADPERIRGLPIHITHGALDWMFEVEIGRQAHAALSNAGAEVVYREVADLSHTYAREVNPGILDWLGAP